MIGYDANGTNGIEHNENSSSLSQQVYTYLVDRIIKGYIHYGEKLSIKKIAAELNVSTMPIRDAMKQLESEQLVIVKPRSSCIVRTPSKTDILQSLEARKMIELHVARTIYSGISVPELKPLVEIVERMSAFVEVSLSDVKSSDALKLAYIELDRDFHTTFCSLAKNSFIDKFYRETSLHLSMSFRYEVGLEHSVFQTYEVHRAIVGYLKEKSANVINLVNAHLDLSYHHIVNGELFQKLPD